MTPKKLAFPKNKVSPHFKMKCGVFFRNKTGAAIFYQFDSKAKLEYTETVPASRLLSTTHRATPPLTSAIP